MTGSGGRIRTLGIVLLLTTPLLLIGMLGAGGAARIGETPPRLLVDRGLPRMVGVCSGSPSPCAVGSGSGGPSEHLLLGVDYVAPVASWVVGVRDGPVVTIPANGGAWQALNVSAQGDCSLQAQYYPGSGSLVLTGCLNASGYYLQLYDAGTNRMVQSVGLPTACRPSSLAFDPVSDRAFCEVSEAMNLEIRTVNMTTGEGSTSAAGANATPSSPMFWDSVAPGCV